MPTVSTAPPGAAAVLEQLRTWQGQLPAELRPLFMTFVEETLRRLRGPYLAHHSPRQVLNSLEEAYLFAHQRPEGPKVSLRAGHGRSFVVLSNMLDRSFIVDSIRLFLKTGGSAYLGGFNLVFEATRDESGRLIGIGAGPAARAESLVMLEAEGGRLVEDLAAGEAELLRRLQLVAAAVDDFRPIQRLVERFIERARTLAERRPDQREQASETADFLAWLLKENFVFMGASQGDLVLGIQKVPGPHLDDDPSAWAPPHPPGTVRLRKTQFESPIHRAGRIDEIEVSLDGESLLIRGLFTYRAITSQSRGVPILRTVLQAILLEQAAVPGSHRYKGYSNAFDSLPTEFLLTVGQADIARMMERIFDSEQRSAVTVDFTPLPGHGLFAVVAMPKQHFSDRLRSGLEDEILQATGATYIDHGNYIGRYDTVLLYFYATGGRSLDQAEQAALLARLTERATPWLERVARHLQERHGEERATWLIDTYGRAFPPQWAMETSTEQAIRDLEMLEELASGHQVLADLVQEADNLRLRLYQRKNEFLTSILPVLDNFGVVVKDASHIPVASRGGKLDIDIFRIDPDASGGGERLLERKAALAEALSAVFAEQAINDPLNKLVLRSGLTWQEVDVIRAYASYSRQFPIKVSGARVREILLSNPIMCRTLVELFHARFNPDLSGSREEAIRAARDQVKAEFRYIVSNDESRVFSALEALIEATLRTNAYRTDRVQHYLSFKIDCAKVALMGDQRPMVEIYVHHRLVEGVHLRFGKVARGGLRWSDRDDFRTEVLGLATTQRVKNVVIVPTGSKGGFFLKNPSRDPKVRRREADELYKIFIRGLLDLTDNVVEGQPVPPPRVVRHDGDDPYLVVAADKGTAHLSDTANSLSRAYGFWLGDAFASGGGNGYDHKKVGITARGGWVLVNRHFLEMGIDPYRQPFTCAGIGDLSGDVFGNGLIESRCTKLLAAFNHLHIFLDPDPDPATTWVERRRLFDTQGGWDKYDRSLLSPGGGIFERSARSIPLSPQVRAMLGLDLEEAEPEVVMQAILRMKVDLLWNGGIGTYVKATYETHADADDGSNDAIRISASELGARVVGEGGNLGFTQPARIEADLRGIRLNTDFIDNSGGVDLSDHEVNLKILFGDLMSRGELTLEERNVLLEQLTEEVAGLVLANNDAHGRQLSRDQLRSQRNIFAFGRAIAFIERAFGVDRAKLRLPNDATLAQRAAAGQGLTRPELATLSSWVKMFCERELLQQDLSRVPGFDALLVSYFPKTIQERFEPAIRRHLLGRQIAVTMAITKVICDAGAAFVPLAVETTGHRVAQVFEAYLKAQRVAQIDTLRESLQGTGSSVSLPARYQAWVMADAGVLDLVSFWLSAGGSIPDDQHLDSMAQAVEQVYALQAREVMARNQATLQQLVQHQIPDGVARQVLQSQYTSVALTVWSESRRTGLSFPQMVVRHLAAARASRLQGVLDDLANRSASGRWDPIALRILQNRFQNVLRRLVTSLPHEAADSVDALEARLVEGPLREAREQVEAMIAGEAQPSVATLLVLEERLTGLLQRLSPS